MDHSITDLRNDHLNINKKFLKPKRLTAFHTFFLGLTFWGFIFKNVKFKQTVSKIKKTMYSVIGYSIITNSIQKYFLILEHLMLVETFIKK